MKKELDSLLKILNINEDYFKKEWNFSNEELDVIKNKESGFLSRHSLTEDEKKILEKFDDIYCHFKPFILLNVPSDMVFSIFSEKTKKNGISIFDLIKHKKDYFVISKILDKKYEECFRELKIGSRMSQLEKLNKEISEKLFNLPVDIKDVWEYSDGGDYTVLKVQSRTEIYEDGSEWWEDLKNYCSNLNDAWLVVKKMQDMGAKILINNVNSISWEVSIEFNNKKEASLNQNVCVAICEASLKSLNTQD